MPAALRLTITASPPSDVELPGLEAQADVEAGEALDVAEGPDPPLLVLHEQERGLGEARAPLRRRQRAQQTERQHDAALHVDRPGAEQLVAVARERPMPVVGDDGVEVTHEHEPP